MAQNFKMFKLDTKCSQEILFACVIFALVFLFVGNSWAVADCKYCVHGQCHSDKCVCNLGWQGSKCDFCGGRIRLTEVAGSISDGSGNYTENNQCSWLVDATGLVGNGRNTSEHAKIHLHLSHFATECSWDHLYVYDGDSVFAPLLAVYSGLVVSDGYQSTEVPELVTSSGFAFLHFYSDAAYNLTGFDINYRVGGCPGGLNSSGSWAECSDRGRCVNEVCRCEEGWTGSRCTLPACPSHCSSNGHCDRERETCVCQAQFTGPDCSQSVDSVHWRVLSFSTASSDSWPRASALRQGKQHSGSKHRRGHHQQRRSSATTTGRGRSRHHRKHNKTSKAPSFTDTSLPRRRRSKDVLSEQFFPLPVTTYDVTHRQQEHSQASLGGGVDSLAYRASENEVAKLYAENVFTAEDLSRVKEKSNLRIRLQPRYRPMNSMLSGNELFLQGTNGNAKNNGPFFTSGADADSGLSSAPVHNKYLNDNYRSERFTHSAAFSQVFGFEFTHPQFRYQTLLPDAFNPRDYGIVVDKDLSQHPGSLYLSSFDNFVDEEPRDAVRMRSLDDDLNEWLSLGQGDETSLYDSGVDHGADDSNTNLNVRHTKISENSFSSAGLPKNPNVTALASDLEKKCTLKIWSRVFHNKLKVINESSPLHQFSHSVSTKIESKFNREHSTNSKNVSEPSTVSFKNSASAKASLPHPRIKRTSLPQTEEYFTPETFANLFAISTQNDATSEEGQTTLHHPFLERASHATVAIRDVIWIIGGFSFKTVPFLLRYNVTEGRVDAVTAKGGREPEPRHGVAALHYNGSVYVYGGMLRDGSVSAQLWRLNTFTLKWSSLGGARRVPHAAQSRYPRDEAVEELEHLQSLPRSKRRMQSFTDSEFENLRDSKVPLSGTGADKDHGRAKDMASTGHKQRILENREMKMRKDMWNKLFKNSAQDTDHHWFSAFDASSVTRFSALLSAESDDKRRKRMAQSELKEEHSASKNIEGAAQDSEVSKDSEDATESLFDDKKPRGEMAFGYYADAPNGNGIGDATAASDGDSYYGGDCRRRGIGICIPLGVVGATAVLISPREEKSEQKIGESRSDDSAVMLLFFGYSPHYGFMNIVQEFHFGSNSWRLVQQQGAVVQGRYGHVAVWDSYSRLVFVHGGLVATSSSSNVVDGLLAFQPDESRWHVLRSSPFSVYLHSAVSFLPGSFVVFGGNSHNDTSMSHRARCYTHTTALYDTVCGNWVQRMHSRSNTSSGGVNSWSDFTATGVPQPDTREFGVDMARYGHDMVVLPTSEIFSNRNERSSKLGDSEEVTVGLLDEATASGRTEKTVWGAGSLSPLMAVVVGGFNGRMLGSALALFPGACLRYSSALHCLTAYPGLKCVWNRVLSKCELFMASKREDKYVLCPHLLSSSGTEEDYKSSLNVVASTVRSLNKAPGNGLSAQRGRREQLFVHHQHNNYSSDLCSQHLDCVTCMHTSYGCVWCDTSAGCQQRNKCKSSSIVSATNCPVGSDFLQRCRVHTSCQHCHQTLSLTAHSHRHSCVWLSNHQCAFDNSSSLAAVPTSVSEHAVTDADVPEFVSPDTAPPEDTSLVVNDVSDGDLLHATSTDVPSVPSTTSTDMMEPRYRPCRPPCYLSTTCANCTMGQCMWCESDRRCVDNSSYLVSFPYGTCRDWTTSPRSCSFIKNDEDACLLEKSCKSCQMSVGCGWCDDGSGTGTGACMTGGATGPRHHDSGHLAPHRCTRHRWYFTSCPACNCNGHSHCRSADGDSSANFLPSDRHEASTSTTSLSELSEAVECIHPCANNTEGLHCQHCRPSFHGSPINGGLCEPCACNGHGTLCDRDTGRCHCSTKGVTGEHCQRCDTQNNYYGDALNGSCFYDLQIDYQFTFNLSKAEDRYVRQINFFNVPTKPNVDTDFDISSSKPARIKISAKQTGSHEVWIVRNFTGTSIKQRFSHTEYAFGSPHNNTTFHVYVYNFTPPVEIIVSFSQYLKLNLLNFFYIFLLCFLCLLAVAALLWKIKQKYDMYARRRRLIVEMEAMASRPFQSVFLELQHQHVYDYTLSPFDSAGSTISGTTPSSNGDACCRYTQYLSSPIALEVCAGGRAAVLSLMVQLPTGGQTHVPRMHPGGLAIASTLVSLGTNSIQRNGLVTSPSCSGGLTENHRALYCAGGRVTFSSGRGRGALRGGGVGRRRSAPQGITSALVSNRNGVIHNEENCVHNSAEELSGAATAASAREHRHLPHGKMKLSKRQKSSQYRREAAHSPRLNQEFEQAQVCSSGDAALNARGENFCDKCCCVGRAGSVCETACQCINEEVRACDSVCKGTNVHDDLPVRTVNDGVNTVNDYRLCNSRSPIYSSCSFSNKANLSSSRSIPVNDARNRLVSCSSCSGSRDQNSFDPAQNNRTNLGAGVLEAVSVHPLSDVDVENAQESGASFRSVVTHCLPPAEDEVDLQSHELFVSS